MEPLINIQEILELMPHRYPFLLIDRVLEFESYQSLKALKNVTINEPYFVGHFPEQPVMPGVLQLEALAQTSAILAFKSLKQQGLSAKGIFYFAGIDNARFKRIVIPGDQLLLEAEVIKQKKDIWKLAAKATVNGELACSADLLAAFKGDVA